MTTQILLDNLEHYGLSDSILATKSSSGLNLLVLDKSANNTVRSLIAKLKLPNKRIAYQHWLIADLDDDSETTDDLIGQDEISAKIAKWRDLAAQSAAVAGFRKASRSFLPASVDPQNTAKKLAVLANKLATKFRSKPLKRLAAQLAEASKSRQESKRIIKALSSDTDIETVQDRGVDSQFHRQIVEAAEDYIRDKVYQMGYQDLFAQDFLEENKDDLKTNWIEIALVNQGWDVPRSEFDSAWEEAIKNLLGTDQLAKKTSSPYYTGIEDGIDFLDFRVSSDNKENCFVSKNSSTLDRFTASKLSDLGLLKIVERLIEYYVVEKNPKRITKEDTVKFLREEHPSLIKSCDKIFGKLEKITHREPRHKGMEKKNSKSDLVATCWEVLNEWKPTGRLACGGCPASKLSTAMSNSSRNLDPIIKLLEKFDNLPTNVSLNIPENVWNKILVALSEHGWSKSEISRAKSAVDAKNFGKTEAMTATTVKHLAPKMRASKCKECKGRGRNSSGWCTMCAGKGISDKIDSMDQPVLSTHDNEIVIDSDYAPKVGSNFG